MRLTFTLCVALLAIGGTRYSLAAFNYSSSGSTYVQDFNTLKPSDEGHDWINDTTLEGWHLYRVTSNSNPTPHAIFNYDASDGGADRYQFYSFGANGDGDRALGGIGGGTFGYGTDKAGGLVVNQTCGWIAVSLLNNTGGTLDQFQFAYDGEQWRDAGELELSEAQTMVLQYGFGADFASVISWTSPGGSYDFTSPWFTTNGSKIDGNSIGLDAGLGGTVSGISWQPGETLWIRWVEKNDKGLDHALAIDNFSFSAGTADVSAVPETETASIFGIICFVFAAVYGRRLSIGGLRAKSSLTNLF